MKRKLLKQVRFNPITMEVTFKLLFVNETVIQEFMDGNGKTFSTEFYESKRKENELRDGTRKRWFQLLTRVLQSQKIEVNKKILKEFSDDMKKQYFDCIEETIADKILVIPPSLTSVPDEQVREANEKILDFYSKIGVDFSDIV